MSYKSKDLRETRAQVAKQMADLVGEAKKSEKGILSAEQRNTFDKMNADIDRLQDEIESHERMEKFESALLDETRNYKPSGKVKSYKPSDDLSESQRFTMWCKAQAGLLTDDEASQYPDANKKTFRTDYSPAYKHSKCVMRAVTDPNTTSANVGGELIPKTLADFVSDYQTAIFDIRQICQVIPTHGVGEFKIPSSDDTAQQSVKIAEAVADVVYQVPTDIISIPAYCFTTKMLKVSFELLESGMIDVQSWFAKKLAQRMERGRADTYCNGDGNGDPEGYKIGAYSTPAVNLASNTAITYAETVKALHAVPIHYRRNAKWVISDSLMQACRSVVATTGQPVWQPSMQVGAPDLLHGKPVYVDPYLDAMGANDRVIGVVGDFNEFAVREVSPPFEIKTSTDRYFEERVLALVGFHWMGSKVLQSKALRKIVTIAT